jgi:hypothetical protein
VSEDWKKNDLSAMRDDIKLLMHSVNHYQNYPEARPFIRRSCDMLVRSLAVLYENQSDTVVKKDFLDLIVRILMTQREKPGSPPFFSVGVTQPLPTFTVYFLTEEARDGFVIFYPRDDRGGRFFRLPLTRCEVKAGQIHDALKLLNPEFVRLVKAEHQAGKMVTVSWNDEAAFAQPETALLDIDYPFRELDTP